MVHSNPSQGSGVKGKAGLILEGCLKEVRLKGNSGVGESSQEGIPGEHEQ